MSAAQELELNSPQQKISPQMRAVLSIFTSDSFMMDAVMPHLDFKSDTIEWDKIFAAASSSAQRVACEWAYSIWTDEIKPNANLFNAALSLDANVQLGILKALRHRWGIRS